MADSEVKALEVLVERLARAEDEGARELAVAASAESVAGELEARAAEDVASAVIALARSERLAAAEAFAGVSAGHMSERARHASRLAAELDAAKGRAESAKVGLQEAGAARKAAEAALARAAAERTAAAKRLEECRAEARKRAEERADEEVSEAAAARSRREDP